MTLIIHIVTEEYQVLVSDGKLMGNVRENFKKQINYVDGFVYYMNQYDKYGWIFDRINELKNENSEITNFYSFRDQIKNRILDQFPDWDIAIGMGFSINGQQEKSIIGNFNGSFKEKVLQFQEVFVSKSDPCIIDAFKHIYMKHFNEECHYPQFNQRFDESKFLKFFHEFYDTAFRIVDNPDFNNSINIGVVRNNHFYNLEHPNTINYI